MKQKMLLILIFILIFQQCDTTEPPTSKASLTLEFEDVSCTEAWIKLTTTNLPLPTSITLKQNDAVRATINLTTPDTLLYVDSLLLKQTYVFQVTSILNPASSLSSNKAIATTLDTTSHNFSWQTFTFGEHSSSVLYDVAIINENNIWAVGEIYMNDSLGNPDPQVYNAIHWDGSEWEVKKITVLFRGSWITPPLEGVFAFSSTDIWFVGSLPIHGNGTNWTMYDLRTTVDPNLSLSKAWGANSNNMYFVGRNGNIAHYQNGVWTKIESGTTVDIQDIWGYENPFTSEKLILCAASYVAQLGEQKILRITSTKTDTINWGTGRRVHSIWFDNDKKLYACGGGVFFSSAPNNDWVEQTEVPLFFTERIRGKGKNDLFTVGHYGLLAHFNGTSWKTYPEASTAVVYNSLVYKNNLIAITGYTETKAVVQFMQHN